MVINGLSRYDVSDNNGKLLVRNLRTGRILKLREKSSPDYYVRVDSDTPVYKSFSQGFLRFLMKNPGVNAKDISPAGNRVRFSEDGNVIDLYDSSERKKPYNSFKDIDDVLATVVLMKAASQGDLSFAYKFIAENREKVILRVAYLQDAPINRVKLYSDDGEELFISQLSTANCQKIIPLFAWLCKCYRVAYLESKRRFVDIQRMNEYELVK